jgi:hypothetical protein
MDHSLFYPLATAGRHRSKLDSPEREEEEDQDSRKYGIFRVFSKVEIEVCLFLRWLEADSLTPKPKSFSMVLVFIQNAILNDRPKSYEDGRVMWGILGEIISR